MFLRDEKDKARKKLIDQMPMVVVEVLESSAADFRSEVGIRSLSPSLHSSPTPIPTIEAQQRHKL